MDMETIYEDSILRELRQMVKEKKMCPKKLLNIDCNIRHKIFKKISNIAELPENYRYILHLQNELMRIKRVNDKKKCRHFKQEDAE